MSGKHFAILLRIPKCMNVYCNWSASLSITNFLNLFVLADLLDVGFFLVVFNISFTRGFFKEFAASESYLLFSPLRLFKYSLSFKGFLMLDVLENSFLNFALARLLWYSDYDNGKIWISELIYFLLIILKFNYTN